MGHGNSDKLYITHAEHQGGLGQHSSSSGYKAKAQVAHPSTLTPFDCCSLSFQPFTHPVCARNSDGTGNVFDLVNIIPWLKRHGNKNPITNEALEPKDLITLHYSRKGSGEIHDPISFKPFSEHSHIVCVATTGNVYLGESVKGGKDLLNDVSIKKSDVITLQNPHGIPTTGASSTVTSSSSQVPKQVIAKPNNKKAKEQVTLPWNVSPYSTGLPGASLTSTYVDPQTETSRLVWDEEELMFEAISNPPKGKGKEKDVGKRRAYVRIVTSLGGSLNVELYCEKAPKTCYNFLMLAREGKYDNCIFHRLIPGFMAQTGDPTGTGSGGQSYWGTAFRDEYDLKNAAKHDTRGVVAMANHGAGTNGSQFYVTFKAASHLDRKHTVFGKVVGGEDVLDALERLPLKPGTDRPSKVVKINEIVIHQDPFEEYKIRFKKRLAKKAEQQNIENKQVQIKDEDVNWFGVKVKIDIPSANLNDGHGVGKYMNVKRSRDTSSSEVGDENDPDNIQKKRRMGFGNFDSW